MLADDSRLDRRFEQRGPLINRMLVQRIRSVLRVDGVPLPSVAPREDGRGRAREALRRRLDPAGGKPLWDQETIAGLVAAVRGSVDAPSSARRRSRRSDGCSSPTTGAPARAGLPPACSTPPCIHAIHWSLSSSSSAVGSALAPFARGPRRRRSRRCARHGIAVHNLVRGFERMRQLWAEPRWRSASRRRGRAMPVRAAERVAAGHHAGRHRGWRGACGHARHARARRRTRAQWRRRHRMWSDIAQCPAAAFVPALLRAVWEQAAGGPVSEAAS